MAYFLACLAWKFNTLLKGLCSELGANFSGCWSMCWKVKCLRRFGGSTHSAPILWRPTSLIFLVRMFGSKTFAMNWSESLLYVKQSLEESNAHSNGFHRGKPFLVSLTSSKPSKCTHSAHSHLNKWETITVDDGNLSLVNKHQHWPWSNASYATLTLLLKRFASGSFLRVTLPSVYINRSIVMSLFSCSKRMMSSSFSTMTLSSVVPACTNHAWDSGDCYWLCIHLRHNHVCHDCRFADGTHVARLQETAIGLKDTRVQSWRLAQKTYTAVRCSVA